MTQPDAELDRVQKLASELIEHYDSVQIFATRHESGEQDGTIRVAFGLGNWYARYGQVREWVLLEEKTSRLKAHPPSNPP